MQEWKYWQDSAGKEFFCRNGNISMILQGVENAGWHDLAGYPLPHFPCPRFQHTPLPPRDCAHLWPHACIITYVTTLPLPRYNRYRYVICVKGLEMLAGQQLRVPRVLTAPGEPETISS